MWEKKGVSDLTDISYVLSHQRSELMVVSLIVSPYSSAWKHSGEERLENE